MLGFQRPKTRVVAMKDFIASPGRIANVGEVVEMDELDARRALACGNAREIKDDDMPRATAPGTVESRDPQVRSRDPFLRRK